VTPGEKALNRLAKWRSILTGWQLGTRERGDPTSEAVRDHREVTLLLRAEVNALCMLMIKKGVFTQDEWDAQLVDDAQHLERQMELKFPGARAGDDGMHIDFALAQPWLSKFPP
jgi:hypothetical protein